MLTWLMKWHRFYIWDKFSWYQMVAAKMAPNRIVHGRCDFNSIRTRNEIVVRFNWQWLTSWLLTQWIFISSICFRIADATKIDWYLLNIDNFHSLCRTNNSLVHNLYLAPSMMSHHNISQKNQSSDIHLWGMEKLWLHCDCLAINTSPV